MGGETQCRRCLLIRGEEVQVREERSQHHEVRWLELMKTQAHTHKHGKHCTQHSWTHTKQYKRITELNHCIDENRSYGESYYVTKESFLDAFWKQVPQSMVRQCQYYHVLCRSKQPYHYWHQTNGWKRKWVLAYYALNWWLHKKKIYWSELE